MKGILEQLKIVCGHMIRLQAPWALIGGLAVSVHGTPRTTRDIDLAISLPNESDLDRLVNALLDAGFFDKQLIMHVAPVCKLGIRLRVPASSPVPVDLLYSSSGIEKETVSSAQSVEIFPNLFVPVATRGHLIAMKVVSENDSDRLQDALDIQGLLKEAKEVDIETAKSAMKLIEQRGFNRGKNLLRRFDELWLQFGYNK